MTGQSLIYEGPKFAVSIFNAYRVFHGGTGGLPLRRQLIIHSDIVCIASARSATGRNYPLASCPKPDVATVKVTGDR